MSHRTPLRTQTPITRRSFLSLTAATAAGIALRSRALAKADGGAVPITGEANPELEPFDRLMTSFIEENKVPGASLAVTRHGKLVYARGFGYSDLGKKEAVKPDALFRIASVSKPFTAVAVLQLVQKGKLRLDGKVLDCMTLKPFVPPGAKPDPRWEQITVRQCLQHTGGWDRDVSYDPIARPSAIAKALGIGPPVAPVQIVRYMMGQPLDFDPGQRYAYSNLGYLVLGRVIEAVTGQNYEVHVKKEVFEPLGIKTPRLGRALLEHRAQGEVRYYDSHERTAPALYPPHIGKHVPLQYGGENFEAFEAHGGWIASAIDLVQFASAFDISAKCPLLDAKSVEQMWARPNGAAGTEPDGKPKAAFYACGWMVRPIRGMAKLNTWHAGNIAGSEALLVRRWDGLNWAVLFNTARNPSGSLLAGLIDSSIHAAADKVKKWPDVDQVEKT